MPPQQDQRPSTPDLPRETFIALRARRQAHRVASDLLYHDDASEDSRDSFIPTVRRSRRDRWTFRPYINFGAMVMLALMMLCVIACVVITVSHRLIQVPRGL
jgi:hypothetical protein